MNSDFNKENFQITICSPPDREDLVSEVYYKNSQWAEINQEKGTLEIQFYPHPSKSYWEFNLDEALAVLGEAKKKLVAMGPKP